MLRKWLPLNFILKRAASSYGFIDPVTLLAKLRRFGHPSEVQEPIELIRAGVVFHARGLINTRAIQYNLDWVWPYWVVKQFKPHDSSFIPRGFSFSHVNLTHRNWTAVGLPDCDAYPIIDPRGLVTPIFDGWSLDFWVISKRKGMLFPSQATSASQKIDFSAGPAVHTHTSKNGLELNTSARVVISENTPQLLIHAETNAEQGDWIVLAFRPYNPEGIQFIEHIRYDKNLGEFLVNEQDNVSPGRPPEKILFSTYNQGDVSLMLNESQSALSADCSIGMATAAAFFPIRDGRERDVEVRMTLHSETPAKNLKNKTEIQDWNSHIAKTAKLRVPDQQIQFLYDAAVHTLLLLSADEAFPGPYTYKRFWFRDSCFIIHALLALGLGDRSESLVSKFPARQKMSGYFQSQEGEWDSNGQVLWIADRLQQLTGCVYDKHFLYSLVKGADWIHKKRIKTSGGEIHQGLFPPGFSAEHLGPNDYYYWDNFWGLAGLRALVRLGKRNGLYKRLGEIQKYADDFEKSIFWSISQIPENVAKGAIPASPYRRMDAGAVGSLVADYPLQLTPPGDTKIMNTIQFLKKNCFHSGAFFQDMIHSGINVYLTLDIAQTLLRAGEPGYRQLIDITADLASPTGQWPEAIHPITGGGCMGDGQHGWAAAEWIMMIRNLFIREEKGKMIVGSGLFPRWLENNEESAFGPTLIPGAKASVRFRKPESENAVYVDIDCAERRQDISFHIEIPGYRKEVVENSCKGLKVEPV